MVPGWRALHTGLSNTVWVYSAASAQQGLVSLPSVQGLTGQGNWLWNTSVAVNGTSVTNNLTVYAIGSATPAATFSFGGNSTFIGSGTTIGVLGYGTADLSVVDLSASSPTRTDYAIPQLAYLSAFAAASASQWMTGTNHGVLVDGASISSGTRYFGFGAVLGIATTPNVTAVSTSSGKLLLFDPSTSMQTGSIDTFAGKVRLSADGSVLAAVSESLDAQYEPDRSLSLYSLPSTTAIQTIPYTFNSIGIPYLTDFSLSASGTVLGQVLLNWSASSGNVTTETITHVSDGSVIWTNSAPGLPSGPILLSTDGTLSAVPTQGGAASDLATNIYDNGMLVTAVPGTGEGWIDNGHLLVANFTEEQEGPIYSGYSIVAPDGRVLSTLAASAGMLPAMSEPVLPDFPTSDSAYAPATNSIYSLTTGQPLWQGPPPKIGPGAIGAAAGSVVVYEAGHRLSSQPCPEVFR